MGDGYGPERTVDSQSICGLASIPLTIVIATTTEAIFHGRASRQAEAGRRFLRFAFQVAAPSPSVSHYRGLGLCLSTPGPFCISLAGRIPADRRTITLERRQRKEPRSLACAVSKQSLCLPARGMNGCGPTALVRPGRGHRRM